MSINPQDSIKFSSKFIYEHKVNKTLSYSVTKDCYAKLNKDIFNLTTN